MTEAEIRNTFRHHSPSQDAVAKHERIREVMTNTVIEVAAMLPESNERTSYIALMQHAQMQANAAIAIHEQEV